MGRARAVMRGLGRARAVMRGAVGAGGGARTATIDGTRANGRGWRETAASASANAVAGMRRDARARAASASTAASGRESGDYDAGSIQVLQGLEPVRKRPGMYIGSTSTKGLHHLVWEVLDNSVDEVQAGHASHVRVVVEENGFVSVVDDGRGIPTDVHPVTGKSSLETVLTILHAGGKFGGDSSGYHVSGGLHGVGISVVNALSELVEVTVWRNGNEYMQSFSRGIALGPMQEKKQDGSGQKKGTMIRFKPDDQIFDKVKFDPTIIRTRMKELAFLNSGTELHLRTFDKKTKEYEDEKLLFAEGLKDYVLDLTSDATRLHEPITFSGTMDGVRVEGALCWTADSYSDTLLGYANSIRTTDGGTHLDGLKYSLTKTLNVVSRKAKLLKDSDPNLGGDHIREGLSGVIAVWVPEPEFEGQTKTRLGNSEVRRIVENIANDAVAGHMEFNPSVLKSIFAKAQSAFKAAEAAKRAREMVRRKTVLTSNRLPGKLSDCSSSDADQTEIFLVEGDSAGGSCKQGRDRGFQAVLPLRGKIMNVERKLDAAALYKNTEITNMISALGLGGMGEDVDTTALRYSKIIILTDADVDGAHIRTLLLTFLYRYQRDLFEKGYVYAAVPPLYKVVVGKKETYCYDEDDLQEVLVSLPEGGAKHIQRFKGLGEMMPEQLWSTTLNPKTRVLKRLTVDDASAANHMFSTLMSKDVEPRRKLITDEGSTLASIDI
jgi:DNA gyrase subunit B